MSIDTVIFDLDGVILDSEHVWHTVRRDFALAHGGHWGEDDQRAVMGANSMQWAAYMHEQSGVELADLEIYNAVTGALRDRYAQDLPLVLGAKEAILRLAAGYRLGVASSSPRELIEEALELAGVRPCFEGVISADEVSRGKPAPDVYLEACACLGASPQRSAAVEDSENGIRAATAAGLAVVAVPNADFPPSAEATESADVVLDSIAALTPEIVALLRPEACLGD